MGTLRKTMGNIFTSKKKEKEIPWIERMRLQDCGEITELSVNLEDERDRPSKKTHNANRKGGAHCIKKK